jgi:hypothetical protein
MLVDLYESSKVTTFPGQTGFPEPVVSFRAIRELRHRHDGRLIHVAPAPWPSRRIQAPGGSSLVDQAGATWLRVGHTNHVLTAAAALSLALRGRAGFAVAETWRRRPEQAALPLSYEDPTLPPARRYP